MSERAATVVWQPTLFGAGEPAVDEAFATVHRHHLPPDAWVDFAPGWVAGADRLFADLVDTAPWEGREVWMYERRVVQPRLTARMSRLPPPLTAMAEHLGRRYATEFVSVGLNLYRDGRDSVAWHGDRVARELTSAVVAIVSLGDTRRFLLRPKGGGRSKAFVLRSGDLLVMGGSCQRTWDHSVPKVAGTGGRLSITFRHAY